MLPPVVFILCELWFLFLIFTSLVCDHFFIRCLSFWQTCAHINWGKKESSGIYHDCVHCLSILSCIWNQWYMLTDSHMHIPKNSDWAQKKMNIRHVWQSQSHIKTAGELLRFSILSFLLSLLDAHTQTHPQKQPNRSCKWTNHFNGLGMNRPIGKECSKIRHIYRAIWKQQWMGPE